MSKYCRGCVPGIPGGIDAYEVLGAARLPNAFDALLNVSTIIPVYLDRMQENKTGIVFTNVRIFINRMDEAT